jgi:hypothetical protein
MKTPFPFPFTVFLRFGNESAFFIPVYGFFCVLGMKTPFSFPFSRFSVEKRGNGSDDLH